MASRTLKTERKSAGTRINTFNYSNGSDVRNPEFESVIEFYDGEGRRNVVSFDPSRIDHMIAQLEGMKALYLKHGQDEMLVHPMLRKA